jgi:hypothetical protein
LEKSGISIQRIMKTSNLVVWLSSLIVVLAIVAASIGLFWQDGGSSFAFTTLHGNQVQIYGQGLYRYDTTLMAIGLKAGDAVTLMLGIPALLCSLWLYRRGSVRGELLLSGTLAYFLYYYGSLVIGGAYNHLFLVYLVLLSASLFGSILLLTSFDLALLPSHFSPRLPRRGIGIYLIVSGVVLILIWLLLSILPALWSGKVPPEVGSYTTIVIYVIDMGIVAPVLIIAGIMLFRRNALGYLLASTSLVFTTILGINLLTAGIVQKFSGLISIGQFIGFVVSFAILTLFAIGFTFALFRNVSESISSQDTHLLDVV